MKTLYEDASTKYKIILKQNVIDWKDEGQEQDYEVFARKIQRIGYEIRSIKRVKNYHAIYNINDTFEVTIDAEGNKVLDEEFTETIKEFKEWALKLICKPEEYKLVQIGFHRF